MLAQLASHAIIFTEERERKRTRGVIQRKKKDGMGVEENKKSGRLTFYLRALIKHNGFDLPNKTMRGFAHQAKAITQSAGWQLREMEDGGYCLIAGSTPS